MNLLFAKSDPEWTTLLSHTEQVITVPERMAEHLSKDKNIARNGAILHDIGKAHHVFQERLKKHPRPTVDPFVTR